MNPSRIAEKLVAAREFISQTVSDEFFQNHPDWLERYGERGRQFCKEDTKLHLQFLGGAIEARSPESFADYALWTARMLDSRGIGADSLKENFARMGHHLSTILPAGEYAEVATFLACQTPSIPETPELDGRLRLTREVFLAAILSGQRQAALNIVDEALRAGRSHIDIYVDVFAESLHQVGRLWESNKISVAQEHMATAITQYAIAGVYPRLVASGPPRGQMIVTGVAGEQHQIGANLVADAMETKGWSVRFLGSNLPHSAVLDAVERSFADVLCVSTTIVANLPAAADLIRSVRARLGERAPKIVLGGAAYRFGTHFAEDVGAWAPPVDLRSALSMLCPASTVYPTSA